MTGAATAAQQVDVAGRDSDSAAEEVAAAAAAVGGRQDPVFGVPLRAQPARCCTRLVQMLEMLNFLHVAGRCGVLDETTVEAFKMLTVCLCVEMSMERDAIAAAARVEARVERLWQDVARSVHERS